MQFVTRDEFGIVVVDEYVLAVARHVHVGLDPHVPTVARRDEGRRGVLPFDAGKPPMRDDIGKADFDRIHIYVTSRRNYPTDTA